MKRIFYILSIIALVSCQPKDKFQIHGTIEGAAGEMVYLEHSGLSKISPIDSIKINKKEAFKFKHAAPEYPDFYRLRLGNKHIVFAVDSTETIELQARKDSFSEDYAITGSASNQDIKWLRNSVAGIQKELTVYVHEKDAAQQELLLTKITEMLEVHKDSASQIILKNPRSTSAYFAVYQKVNGIQIFTPYDKNDRPYWASVATAYHSFMPKYNRSKNIYNYVLEAINAERQERYEADWKALVEEMAVGFIDIELPDKEGNMQKLSDNVGKVILLDFSFFNMRGHAEYVFVLRDLYRKYASKGFTIYQVSVDTNKLLWEEAVKELPWTCVWDEERNEYLRLYNISSLPSFFLINRQGDIVAKNIELAELGKYIEKEL